MYQASLFRYVSRPLAAAALLLLSGCGGDPGNVVTGTVTLQGRPVSGSVCFIGPDGKTLTEPINPGDGSYAVRGVPAGENIIVVKGAVTARPRGTPKGGVKGMEMPSAGVPPPARYATPSNGLRLEVTGGEQKFDVELRP